MGCELWISHLFPKLGNSISKRLLFKGSFLKGYILSCGSTFWSIDPASCAASIFSSDPFGLEKSCIMLSCPLKKKNKKSISESYNFLYCGGGSLRGVVHSISEKNTQTQKRDCVSSSVFSLLPRNQVFTLAVEAVQTWNAASPWSLMSVFLVIKVAFFSLLSELIRLQSK